MRSVTRGREKANFGRKTFGPSKLYPVADPLVLYSCLLRTIEF